MAVDEHAQACSRPARHSAETPAAAPAAPFPAPAHRLRRHARSRALSAGTASRSSSLAAEPGMIGLAEDARRAGSISAVVCKHRFHARRIGLPQRPRLLPGEIAIGFRHHAEDRRKRQMDCLLGHRLARRRRALPSPGRGSPCRHPCNVAALRHDAVAVLGDHRQRALRQIAEIVGEIGIGAVDDRFVAVAAVLAERHLAQEEVAHLVEAVMLDQRERIDDIADRLRHFLAAVEQEAVREDPLRQRRCRPTSGRPASRPRGSARCPCR